MSMPPYYWLESHFTEGDSPPSFYRPCHRHGLRRRHQFPHFTPTGHREISPGKKRNARDSPPNPTSLSSFFCPCFPCCHFNGHPSDEYRAKDKGAEIGRVAGAAGEPALEPEPETAAVAGADDDENDDEGKHQGMEIRDQIIAPLARPENDDEDIEILNTTPAENLNSLKQTSAQLEQEPVTHDKMPKYFNFHPPENPQL